METQPDYGDVTEQVQAHNEKPANAYLELQLIHHGLGEFRIPFITAEIDLSEMLAEAFPSSERWLAKLDGDGVSLEEVNLGLIHQLAVGDRVESGTNSFFLVDTRRPPVATLEGLSEPYIGRSWHIRLQKTFLGRAGKRINHIELSHPTVSRTHITFLPDSNGSVSLLNETKQSATTVNGNEVPEGKQCRLNHGDLLAVGELLFRFSSTGGLRDEGSVLSLTTLGTFLVELGATSNLESKIKQKKALWLLALLGTKWGKPVSVESIIDKLWPDVVVLRGRKNLSALLAHLQSAFGLDDEAFQELILRTPTSLQLNPSRLGSHDFTEVEKLTQGGEALTSEVALDRLLGLYQGSFLPGCYDDWAETMRQDLEAGLVDVLNSTARRASDTGHYELVEKSCSRLLRIDPCDEDAAELWAQSARASGREDKALQIENDLQQAFDSDDV